MVKYKHAEEASNEEDFHDSSEQKFEHFGENCDGTFNLELGVGRHCPKCGRWYLGADC